MPVKCRDIPVPGIRRGMTLLECLVAMVILGMGLAGLISAASLSLRNQLRTEHRATALCLAQEKLAEVEMEGPHASQSGATQGTQNRGSVAYAWTLTIEPTSVGELYDVRAEVDWSGAGGPGQVQLETLLNDYQSETPAGQRSQPGADQADQTPGKVK
jgi:type II secretion system protein I